MSVQRLPYEILESIFRTVLSTSLRKGDIASCALVCHSWYLPACRILYEQLSVKSISQMINRFSSQNNNMGVYCKVLEFNSVYGNPQPPPEQYEQLFLYLPNLQTITLNCCTLRSHHLNQIAQYPELVKNLKGILLQKYGWEPEQPQSYYNCAIAFKNTLQHMTLDLLGVNISSTDGRYGNLTTFLPDFVTLTTLEIANRSYRTPNLPQLSMFHILRSCPNLTSFCLQNSFDEPENDNSTHVSFNHNKLKYLELSIPGITKHQISYMVANITHLKEFKLECQYTNSHSEPISWMERIGIDHLLLLRTYLSGIEKVDLNIKRNFKTNIIEFWPFASGIIGNNRSTPTHVCLKIYEDNNLYSRSTMLKKCADFIYIQCGIDYEDFPSVSELLASPTLLQPIVAPPELSENNIQSYNIQHDGTRSRENVLYHTRLNILESVSTCLRNLNNFGITSDLSFSPNFSFRVASRKIEDSSNEHITHQSIMALPHRSILPSNKLTHAIVQNIHSTEDISPMLTFFSNIKHLKIIDCGFTLDNNSNVTIDLNDIQLKQLELDMSYFSQRGQGMKTIIFQVEEKEEDRISCFKWKREKKTFEEIVLESVEDSYSKKYGRFSSSHFNTFFIKCHRLEQLKLFADIGRRRNSIITTVSLTHDA